MSSARTGSLYPVAKGILGPSTRFLFPTKVEGLENVPRSGPAIIAPNHISFLDSAVLIGVLPRRITYVGKAEYMDSWKTKFLFPAIGMIPIDRSGGTASVLALDAAAGVLDKGELFGIFPEGTRSRDEFVHKGRTGVARLALRMDVPLIPVGIVGTDLIQPPGASVPRPFRHCTVRFGAPIDLAPYRSKRGAIVYRNLTDALMFEISELSGRSYENRYAERPTEAPALQAAPVEAPAVLDQVEPQPEPVAGC